MEAVSRRVQRGSGVDNYAAPCCAAPTLECLCVDAGLERPCARSGTPGRSINHS